MIKYLKQIVNFGELDDDAHVGHLAWFHVDTWFQRVIRGSLVQSSLFWTDIIIICLIW